MVVSEQSIGSQALVPPKIKPPDRPLSLPVFIYRFIKNPLLALPQPAYEEPIFLYRPSGGAALVAWVTDPDLTETILQNKDGAFCKTALERRALGRALGEGVLTADGAQWRWQRHAIAPLFRHSEILSYVPQMRAAADDLVAQWQHDGTRIRPIEADMTDVTFSVIARTMLVGGEPAESAAIKTATDNYLSCIPWEMVWELFHVPQWLPHPRVWRLNQTARSVRLAVHKLIDKRRMDGNAAESHDLLARLLCARHPDTGAPMDDELLIDNLLTLLLAGHETTAKALTWTLYLLARAPDWQQQVRDEVASVVSDGPVTAEKVEKLEVTERVLKEAMRLYPPVPVIARNPVHDVSIGGQTIPANTQVVIPMFCVHRHRRLWTDPDTFQPNRFLPEHANRMARTQYMPFGAGARTCLGMSFAMVEAKVLLATFLRAAAFSWDGKHRPEPVSRITLRPKGGMPLGVNLLK